MDKYKSLLKELVSFKSISTDKAYVSEINKTVDWLLKQFEKNGFSARAFEGYGNPVVYAKYEVSPNAKTVLIYGHYDVQPASKEDGWSFDPFVLTEKEGKLYARGVVDNKGQFLIHLVSVLELIEQGSLKYNVKFLIEGNEETGGAGLDRLIKEEKEEFACDYIMISDGELPYKPVITASFRGTANITLNLRTAKNNLHSGLYGGAVPSASVELANLLSSLYDDNYRVKIPGFYDGLAEMTEEEKEQCLKMDKERQRHLDSLGIKKFFIDDKGSFSATVGFESMVMPTGISSGYTGEGYSNIVPSSASAKINFRIGANQNTKEMVSSFKEFVKSRVPNYVFLDIDDSGEYIEPVKVDITSPMHQKTINLLKEVYKDDVLVDYCGATIPIVVDFKEVFGVDPLLVSLGNDDCNMHGVDENFDIGLIKKGLEFSKRFFSQT